MISTSQSLPHPFQARVTPAALDETRERLAQTLDQENLPTPLREAQDAQLHAEIAGALLLLGDARDATHHATRAVKVASESGQIGQIGQIGYYLCIQGAGQCALGDYATANRTFENAEAVFSRGGDALGIAWKQHLLAREYYYDRNASSEALTLLGLAFAYFRANAIDHALIENLLAQAGCLVQMGDVRRATDLLKQAEAQIEEHEACWFLPELALLRARIALLENHMPQAAKHAYKGLSHIGACGDLRTLSALYLTLGQALESDRSQLINARDALHRAVNVARGRARRLDLARALSALGLHLRRYSQRMTARARGSGYLFESDQLYLEIGMRPPQSAPAVNA